MSEQQAAVQAPAETSLLREASLDGFAGGGAGFITEVVMYGLDSYKIMQQSGGPVVWRRLFRGAIPIALTGSTPSFAAFFGIYAPVKALVEHQMDEPTGSPLPALIASLAGGVPASLVAVPADLIKKQLVLTSSTSSSSSGAGGGVSGAVRRVLQARGISGLFAGWQVNLLKDIPFAAIKMVLYEQCVAAYIAYRKSSLRQARRGSTVTDGAAADHGTLSSTESAGMGLISGAITGVVTCPIDVVNTRIKSGEFPPDNGIIRTHMQLVKQHGGLGVLFSGVLPRVAIIGLGSTVFWFLYASCRKQAQTLFRLGDSDTQH